jgi:L-fucono-1,5-lactonase
LIDAHQHFWKYTPEEYSWIDDSMSVLRTDFLPSQLEQETKALGFVGAISVQARQTLEETEWLLNLAQQHEFIRGVVGWVPLTLPDIRDLLDAFSENLKLKGIRHVLQSEPDDNYMLRDEFNAGISCLEEFGLVYDILIFERHLPQTIAFVDRHPNQTFVLDHIAKPRVREGVLSPWRENLRQLAERPNVFCKISGMVTEAGHNSWTEEQLAPYFEVVLNAFNPGRLMFGSDWPVCLAATTYSNWFSLLSRQIQSLSESERDSILGRTAVRVYRLAI